MVGSREDSEFALAPERALMASCKFGEILSTALDGSQVIDLFQEQVIGGLPSIRDAVNSGGRTFREIIQLIENGKQIQGMASETRRRRRTARRIFT